MIVKICPACFIKFNAPNKKQVCCSIKCRFIWRRIKFYKDKPIKVFNNYIEFPIKNGGWAKTDYSKNIIEQYLWSIDSPGYVYRTIDRNHSEYLHRIMMKVTNPNEEIDHIDLKKLNN